MLSLCLVSSVVYLIFHVIFHSRLFEIVRFKDFGFEFVEQNVFFHVVLKKMSEKRERKT